MGFGGRLIISLMITIVAFGIIGFTVLTRFTKSTKQYMEYTLSKLEPAISSVDADLTPARLIRVIDGDTLLMEIEGEEKRVRLIGINTPESVHPDETKNSVEGDAASKYIKGLLAGYDELYLQIGKDPEDDYGRILAYVWLSGTADPSNREDARQYMLNAILLSNRIAEPMAVEPNTEYAMLFAAIYAEAVIEGEN